MSAPSGVRTCIGERIASRLPQIGVFGALIENRAQLNECGQIVAEEWNRTEALRDRGGHRDIRRDVKLYACGDHHYGSPENVPDADSR